MNQVNLIGNISSEIEYKLSPDNKLIAKFQIEVKDGRTRVFTFDCIAWDVVSNIMKPNAKNGDLLSITGKLTPRVFEKNGRQVNAYEIVVNTISFIERVQTGYDPKSQEFMYSVEEVYKEKGVVA